ncbi:Imm50 family immunity protein [Streptomyces sp. NPDC050534]|uniref:Imm50 family immunity protein n=1 Tax=Streptomyces sp. NPDC050534 TaxID=3365625 RepID=UPI0037B4A15D
MGADWRRLLSSQGFLAAQYGDLPPAPDACRLFYVHFDERGNSATLGFETREFPVNPLQEWVEKGLNAFEFYLTFTHLTDLRVTGWGHTEAQRVGLAVDEDGRLLDVTVGSDTSGIAFRASAVRLSKSRAYLASGSR